MSFAREIHRGCRRAFIADSWSTMFYDSWDEEEAKEWEGWTRPNIPGGTNLFDYVPWGKVEVTDFCEAETIEAIYALGRNRESTAEEVFLKSCADHGVDADSQLADQFGHYLAMESMGHGVAWTDDFPLTELKTGDVVSPMWADTYLNHDGTPRLEEPCI